MTESNSNQVFNIPVNDYREEIRKEVVELIAKALISGAIYIYSTTAGRSEDKVCQKPDETLDFILEIRTDTRKAIADFTQSEMKTAVNTLIANGWYVYRYFKAEYNAAGRKCTYDKIKYVVKKKAEALGHGWQLISDYQEE